MTITTLPTDSTDTAAIGSSLKRPPSDHDPHHSDDDHLLSLTQDSIGNPSSWNLSLSQSQSQSQPNSKRPRLDPLVTATDPIRLAPTALSPIRPRNALSRSAFATLSDDSDDDGSDHAHPQVGQLTSMFGDTWMSSSSPAAPPRPPTPPPQNSLNGHTDLPPFPFDHDDLFPPPDHDDDPFFGGDDMDLDAQLEHEQALLRELQEEHDHQALLAQLAVASPTGPPTDSAAFGLPLETQHLAAAAAAAPAPSATGTRRAQRPGTSAPPMVLRLDPETQRMDYSQPPAARGAVLGGHGVTYTARSSAGTTLYFPARTPCTRIVTAADVKRDARRRARAGFGSMADEAEEDNVDDVDMYALVQRLENEVVLDAERRNGGFPAQTTEPERTRRVRRQAQGEEHMWVDKYHPQTYMDLIGDESVARQVLAWVRAWDTCVFGTKAPKARAMRSTPTSGPSAASTSAKPGAGGGTYTTLSSIERTPGDPLHRPHRKLLLLAGPPGLGKTTLAHVVARHAGYDVTEINASDDRTARAVGDRVTAAMAGATIHQGRLSRRPRLVVIDEIDGAAVAGAPGGEGASLVKLLVGLAEGTPPGGTRGKGTKPSAGLRRPIICICNDPYAPALRPLRQIARVVTVYRPDSHVALVRRLAAIALRENVRVSLQSLHWLATSAEGDIRGCLHALQFAARQQAPRRDLDESDDELTSAERAKKQAEARRVLVTKDMLQRANAATKDGGPCGGLPNVWDAVFSPRAADRLAVDLHVPRQPLTALALAMDRLGELDKLAVGCLEYAVVAHVPEFDRTAGALDQLALADTRIAAGYRPGLGGLGHLVHATVPYSLALVHSQFRGGLATLTANDPWTKLAAKQAAESGVPNHGQARLEYPKSDYEAFVRTRDMHNVIQSMRRAAHPRSTMSLMCLQPGTLAMDVFGGPLARILSPPGMRHANRRLMPEIEHQRTDALVKTLSGLGIALVPDVVDGKQALRMEPPVEMVCGLTTARGKLRSVLPPSVPVRELLATELKSSAIRSTIDGVRETIQASAGKVERDFFGRPIAAKEAPDPRPSQMPELRISRVRFKFNEGYSNAVRRPVYMRDLV